MASQPRQSKRPAVCPNGHAMDEGLFECPACGAYRASRSGRTEREAKREEALRSGVARYEDDLRGLADG